MKKTLTLFFMLFAFQFIAFSQHQNKVDSLLAELKSANPDTNKIIILNSLAWNIWSNNSDSTILLSNQALQLAEKLKWQYGIDTTEWTLGWLYYLTGNYELSLQHYIKAGNIGPYKSSDNEIRMVKLSMALIENNRQILFRNFSLGGLAVVLLFSGILLTQRNKIKKGKKRSDELLLNILPSAVAEELKATGSADAKQFDEVTVMFTDFKNFTQASEKLTPKELVEEINYCYSAFDKIISKYRIEKIKTMGDSYMAAGGLPVENKTNPVDTVNAALEIQAFMQQLKEQRENDSKSCFEIRIGIHTGAVVAGIVGIKKFAYDIWDDTVNIASRMESSGEAGRINISGNTYELVKDKFNCMHRGKIQAKNKGEIDMYFVENVS